MGGRLAGLGSMLRLVARGLAARDTDAEPLPDVPKRKPSVEREGLGLEAKRLERYLAATAGDGVARLKGPEGVVSPVFPAVWETAQALELFAGLDRPLPGAGVVHVEGELVSIRPIAPDDRLRCRVELERAERVRRGVRLTLTSRTWNAAGQLCTQSVAVFLAKTRKPADDDAPKPAPRDDSAERPEEWEEVTRWKLGAGAGRRYASVSGDYNPIHLWSWTARPFGFSRPILHGFCIEAMVAHALIEHRFDGQPTALRRLRIAFRAPLPLPSTACLQVGEQAGQRWFRVTDEPGTKIYAEGTYAGGVQTPRPKLRIVK
jgi:acyl dehydratase